MPAPKSPRRSGGSGPAAGSKPQRPATDRDPTAAEQLLSRISRQLDMVMLTRERIQETLNEAAERGRVTRTDANMLAAELVKRGRQQTDDLVAELEELVGRGREGLESAARRGRDQLESATRHGRDQLERARQSIGGAAELPIAGYEKLSAAQVRARLHGLVPAELRQVREYERRHANRKSVLEAIARALG